MNPSPHAPLRAPWDAPAAPPAGSGLALSPLPLTGGAASVLAGAWGTVRFLDNPKGQRLSFDADNLGFIAKGLPGMEVLSGPKGMGLARGPAGETLAWREDEGHTSLVPIPLRTTGPLGPATWAWIAKAPTRVSIYGRAVLPIWGQIDSSALEPNVEKEAVDLAFAVLERTNVAFDPKTIRVHLAGGCATGWDRLAPAHIALYGSRSQSGLSLAARLVADITAPYLRTKEDALDLMAQHIGRHGPVPMTTHLSKAGHGTSAHERLTRAKRWTGLITPLLRRWAFLHPDLWRRIAP